MLGVKIMVTSGSMADTIVFDGVRWVQKSATSSRFCLPPSGLSAPPSRLFISQTRLFPAPSRLCGAASRLSLSYSRFFVPLTRFFALDSRLSESRCRFFTPYYRFFAAKNPDCVPQNLLKTTYLSVFRSFTAEIPVFTGFLQVSRHFPGGWSAGEINKTNNTE